MRSHCAAAVALVLGAVVASACAHDDTSARAGGTGPNPMLVEEGQQVFRRYCASCHGLDGTGHGPAASALVSPPADLTRVAARRNGRFPDGEIAAFIDGRFATPAHGTRAMPIWGVQLRRELPDSELAEEIVRGQISMLVDYLKSIQQPAPR